MRHTVNQNMMAGMCMCMSMRMMMRVRNSSLAA